MDKCEQDLSPVLIFTGILCLILGIAWFFKYIIHSPIDMLVRINLETKTLWLSPDFIFLLIVFFTALVFFVINYYYKR